MWPQGVRANFFVGLSAAIIEWVAFWLSNVPLGFNIYTSTALSFFLATFANWVVARRTTFKSEAELIKPNRDFLSVFVVSGIGLGLNFLLMALIAGQVGVYPLLAKIMATGVVFFWNFGARKVFIYKTNKQFGKEVYETRQN